MTESLVKTGKKKTTIKKTERKFLTEKEASALYNSIRNKIETLEKEIILLETRVPNITAPEQFYIKEYLQKIITKLAYNFVIGEIPQSLNTRFSQLENKGKFKKDGSE